MIQKDKFGIISSFVLHIIAMCLMLCDHLWGTLMGTQRWMTALGRIAFPIFAFMIVEGYFHTSNIKKYLKRLLIFALISEIPFNVMMSGGLPTSFPHDITDLLFMLRRLTGPFHQNVLWTFLLALLLILLSGWLSKKAGILLDKMNIKKAAFIVDILIKAAICYIGYFIGNITFVDFFGAGILTVLVFWIFHEKTLVNMILQLLALLYINAELLAGMCYPIEIFGRHIEFPEQGLAVLALVPIWLYSGKQGYHSKWFKYLCYSFYPAHMLILAILSNI